MNKRKLTKAEIKILKDFLKTAKVPEKSFVISGSGKDLITVYTQLSGQYVKDHPELYGTVDNTGSEFDPTAAYTLPDFKEIKVLDFFEKRLEIHGYDNKLILNRLIEEWQRHCDKVNVILQEYAYEAARKKANHGKEIATADIQEDTLPGDGNIQPGNSPG
jgi:hypothetical protein